MLVGPPASVDLYCSHQSVYTIKCTWIVPYTLPSVDITGYNINISNATSNLIMMTVDVTEYTYNVSEFGNYTVSVVATIGELEGVIDTTVVNVHKGMRCFIHNYVYYVILYYRQNRQLVCSIVI